MPKVNCPRCDGQGQWYYDHCSCCGNPVGMCYYGAESAYAGVQPCEDCNGTGRIDAPEPKVVCPICRADWNCESEVCYACGNGGSAELDLIEQNPTGPNPGPEPYEVQNDT